MKLPQQRNRLHSSNILLHNITIRSQSLLVLVGKSEIGLHLLDNCLSQVKIEVTTVNKSCFLPYSRSLASAKSFSRTVLRHTEHVRQSTFLPVTLLNVDLS